MTRLEFDRSFAPLVKALQVPVNRAQADYHFEMFQACDARDFAHACQELGIGTPKRLPEKSFWLENIATAKEIRMDREKRQLAGATQNLLTHGPDKVKPLGPGDEEWGPVFAKCCVALILARTGEPEHRAHQLKTALAFIQRQRDEHEGFRVWLKSWMTQGSMPAETWLDKQMAGETTNTPRRFQGHIWSKEELHQVRMAKAERDVTEGWKPKAKFKRY